jgi:lipopolysaccharide/colanic/teichoic acid biosynthesis glycosyltransferase
MISLSSRKITLFAVDTALFFLALFLALLIRRPDIFNYEYFLVHIPTFMFVYFVFIASLYANSLYFVPLFISSIRRLRLVLNSSLSTLFFGSTFFYLFPGTYTPKTVLLIQLVLVFFLVGFWRFIEKNIFKSGSKNKGIIIDDSKEAKEIYDAFTKYNYQISFVKMFHVSDLENKQSVDELVKFINEGNIKFIIIDTRNPKLNSLLSDLYELSKKNVRVLHIFSFYEDVFLKVPVAQANFTWFFNSVSLDLKFYEIAKRVIDLIISIPVLIVFFILHPWVYFNIKREDGGDVFIEQERLGRFGKVIKVKKYRTMKFSDGGKWIKDGDNQNTVTKFGYFLRKTRIDELPQIISVLKGDITLIGPRPDIVNLYDKLSSEIPFYKMRYSVTPGLSGWAQTMQNTPPQSLEETIERLKYDLYYIKHRSTLLDLSIILRTIKTVLSREGM